MIPVSGLYDDVVKLMTSLPVPVCFFGMYSSSQLQKCIMFKKSKMTPNDLLAVQNLFGKVINQIKWDGHESSL